MHIFDLTRILRRGCRHEAGHGESVFVSVGIRPAQNEAAWAGCARHGEENGNRRRYDRD
jgi:hypothetical protein